MNTYLKFPRDGVVFVCDAGRALVLRNEGSATSPSLRVEEEVPAPPNPRAHEQGADRPGRVFNDERRSAVEAVDVHLKNEAVFIESSIERLDGIDRLRPIKALILVAPPRVLSLLRKHLPHRLSALITAELSKDLTKMPILEIERHVLRS